MNNISHVISVLYLDAALRNLTVCGLRISHRKCKTTLVVHKLWLSSQL
jgi:hypothetical protein